MELILESILFSNVCILGIVFISYLIEHFSTWKLLFDNFKIPKSKRTARSAADFHSVLYFIFNFIFRSVYIHRIKIETEKYSFIVWIIIVLIITIILNKVYFRYTKIDDTKEDFDFSD
jgi:hypothetical protein